MSTTITTTTTTTIATINDNYTNYVSLLLFCYHLPVREYCAYLYVTLLAFLNFASPLSSFHCIGVAFSHSNHNRRSFIQVYAHIGRYIGPKMRRHFFFDFHTFLTPDAREQLIFSEQQLPFISPPRSWFGDGILCT